MKVIITHEVKERMDAYTRLVETEVSGIGKVAHDEKSGTLTLVDIEVLEQEATGSTTDFVDGAMDRFMLEKTEAGESVADWWCWWHSHVDMDAFFSGRDTGTIDESTEFRHLLSVVYNRKGVYKARLDTFKPFRLIVDELDVSFTEPPQNTELEAQLKTELDEKVKPKAIQMGYKNKDGTVQKTQQSGTQTSPELWTPERMEPSGFNTIITTPKGAVTLYVPEEEIQRAYTTGDITELAARLHDIDTELDELNAEAEQLARQYGGRVEDYEIQDEYTLWIREELRAERATLVRIMEDVEELNATTDTETSSTPKKKQK